MRSLINSDLTFAGNSDAASLDGSVLIDSLGVSKDFDIADFTSQFSGNAPPPAGNTFADKVKLNIAVQSTAQLAAVSSELSLEGQANLRVIGTASNPVIVGRTELTSGELFFMKRRYQIERRLGGNNSYQWDRLPLQQLVTNNFHFTLSTDSTAAEQEIVQGEYQINQRWSVIATRDAGRGFSVDGKFHSTF